MGERPERTGGGQPDWAALELPDAWPDALALSNPLVLARLFRRSRAHPSRVVLPEGLPGAARIPDYVLFEYHGLPNGNYSNSVTRGYARSFDAVMLGTLSGARRDLARRLAPARRALDLGCGSGPMLAALREAGVGEVVGVDPSPYLLKVAAEAVPEARLLHGVAESLDLPDASVDAVSACFVLHELPARAADAALREVRRVLAPGGRLGFIEPSPHQWLWTRRRLLRRHGLRGLYFGWMARSLPEPFLQSWHGRDPVAWLESEGFRVDHHECGCPLRVLIATREDETSPGSLRPERGA